MRCHSNLEAEIRNGSGESGLKFLRGFPMDMLGWKTAHSDAEGGLNLWRPSTIRCVKQKNKSAFGQKIHVSWHKNEKIALSSCHDF